MSAAFQAIRRVVTVDWPKSGERNAKALLIRTARNGHDRIMADAKSKGLAPAWEAYANTPGNRDLASVVLPGPIVYKYRYLTDIIQVALDELRKRSPVQSGDYVRSHNVYVNGVQVDGIPQLKAGDDVWIANPIPYARRIEVGKTKSGRSFVLQVDPHIYERVAKNFLIPKYRNQANISFGYVSIPAAHVVRGKLSSHYIAKGGARRKRRQAVGSTVSAPAMFISVLT